MSKKETGVPDSDESARKSHHLGSENEEPQTDDIDLSGAQTSNKTGKHSSVEKLAASRPEFGSSPGANRVEGAFGDADEDKIVPGTGVPRDKASKP